MLIPAALGDSQPFLKIAREFEIDYGHVLSYADHAAGCNPQNRIWHQRALVAILRHAQSAVVTVLINQCNARYGRDALECLSGMYGDRQGPMGVCYGDHKGAGG